MVFVYPLLKHFYREASGLSQAAYIAGAVSETAGRCKRTIRMHSYLLVVVPAVIREQRENE
jgi:hypothetical protein